jgi:Arc/MetJ-type ribon-helix-helix transcriptional regulator
MAKKNISLSIDEEIIKQIEERQKKERRGSFSEMTNILIEDGLASRKVNSQSQE